jgi:hypothetical protein
MDVAFGELPWKLQVMLFYRSPPIQNNDDNYKEEVYCNNNYGNVKNIVTNSMSN